MLNQKALITLLSVGFFISCGNKVEITEKRLENTAGSENVNTASTDNTDVLGQNTNNSGDASNASKKLKLSWDKSTATDLTAYKVYIHEENKSLGVEIAEEISIDGTGFNPELPEIKIDPKTHTVVSKFTGKKACLYVKAVNANGESDSSDSQCVQL